MTKRTPIDPAAARRDLDALHAHVRAAADQGAPAARPVELDQQRLGRLSRIDARQNQEMARAVERRRTADLRKIDAALARLAAGDYGWCVRCGEEIAPARLRLDPATPTCVDCAGGASRD